MLVTLKLEGTGTVSEILDAVAMQVCPFSGPTREAYRIFAEYLRDSGRRFVPHYATVVHATGRAGYWKCYAVEAQAVLATVNGLGYRWNSLAACYVKPADTQEAIPAECWIEVDAAGKPLQSEKPATEMDDQAFQLWVKRLRLDDETDLQFEDFKRRAWRVWDREQGVWFANEKLDTGDKS